MVADQRGQQRHLGHEAFDHRGIVVLGQHTVQNPVQTGHPAPDIGPVELKWQDGIVPGYTGAKGHGLSLQGRNWHTASI
jgi:hypothetical protein